MFVLVYFQAWQFLCERIKIKGCTAFLSKVKHKSVNNSFKLIWKRLYHFVLFYPSIRSKSS